MRPLERSELGPSRRFGDVRAMSGLPPIATVLRTSLKVRIVPQADRLTVRNAPSLDGLFFGLLRQVTVIPSSSDRSRPWRSGLCCGCGKLESLDDAIPLPHDQRIHVAHGMAVFGRLG